MKQLFTLALGRVEKPLDRVIASGVPTFWSGRARRSQRTAYKRPGDCHVVQALRPSLLAMTFSTRALVGACALALILGASSCSKTDTTRPTTPTFYDEEAITQANELIGQGYDLLDSADLEGAVAKFAEIEQLVPSGLVGPYHTACAYARTGDKEAAFQQLTRLVDNGYDSPENIRYDPDFESLNDDPRRALRTQSRFWRTTEYIAARMDMAARKLAATRELKADDPEFDYGLERVRSAARLKSAYESGWGAVSDLVLHEVDAYLRTSPAGEGRNEANYRAGFAVSLKYGDDDARRVVGFRQAETYLANVEEGTKYYGASRMLIAINQLDSPGADEETVGPQIKNLIEQFEGDDAVYRIASTRFSNDAARFVWPIALGMTDLEEKTITLDEYKGKALLIDFWATWCPPCRAELPNMVKVYNEYHSRGLEIVSISLDYTDRITPEAYRDWIDSAGMNWRHSYSGDAWSTESVKRYYVGSIPAPFLVGPDGSLVAWGEDLRGEDLAGSVEKALGI